MSIQPVTADSLGMLATDEPPVFRIENATSERPLLIVCDHAGNYIPRGLANLGLEAHHLDQHIAWDLGAAQVATRLGVLLDSQVICSRYSRLVVDVNRHPTDGGSIPALSDGVLVPGNLGLPVQVRQQRFESLFDPYHEAVATTLAALTRGSVFPALVSIHSFTPFLHGVFRPWEIGILWDKDPRIAVPLMASLRQHSSLQIGDNLPYSGMHPADYTMDVHGEAAGLAHVAIEVRQDLIAAEDGQVRMANVLADALRDIVDRDSLYRRRSHWGVGA